MNCKTFLFVNHILFRMPAQNVGAADLVADVEAQPGSISNAMNKSPVRRWAVLLSILGLITSQASFAQCENPVELDDVIDGLAIGFSTVQNEPQPDIVLAAQGIPTRGFISPEARFYTEVNVVTEQYESDYFLTYLWLGAPNAETPEARIQKLVDFRARHSDISLLIDGVPIDAPIMETVPQDGFNPWGPGPMAYMFIYWISEPYSLEPKSYDMRLQYLFDGTSHDWSVSTVDLEVLEGPPEPGANVANNGSFETADISGWFNLGGSASVGWPAAGAQDGNYAAVLTPDFPGTGASTILQNFLVCPGDELYASAYMLTETPLVDGPARPIFKLSFSYVEFIPEFRIIQLAPAAISKGVGGADPFPGIEGLPLLDSGSAPDTWQLTQSQGVAPADTNTASVLLLNVDGTVSPVPIWFDNVILARLEPDDDGDRLENGVDSDPLNVSVDFSDGTTSGSIVEDTNSILGIDDAPEAVDGVRITSDPGSGAAARVRVCDSSATLSIQPGTDVVTTCGSVILAVAPDSESVTMIIEFDGEPATIEVPPEITISYEPETGSLAVESSSNDPEPVILTVGETTVSVYPTSIPGFPVSIDVKPGGYPNCFNINGKGLIPVAILGSDLLDVLDVVPSSLSFGGLDVRGKGSDRPSCGIEDTNSDGYEDLVCYFEDDPALWSSGVTSATLSGELNDGTVISGSDSICIVP